jgi:hypothetical protein
MPWFHRGMAALITNQVDFLTNFGPESWRDGDAEWTEDDLEQIIAEFTFAVDPANPKSERLPLFNYADGNLTLVTSDVAAAILPRGFSKTTLINALNLRAIVYSLRKYILYVSETATHAASQLGTIKNQLASNELLKLCFGELEPGRQESNKWTEHYIEPKNGVKVQAIGRGGQVRGMSKDAQRPDLIIVDDLEDSESVRNPELRLAAKRWVKGTLEPAIEDMGNKRGQIIYIGTLLHPEALMPSLARDPDVISIRLGALDSRGKLLWPHRMTHEQLEKKRLSFAALGQLEEFYLEYLSEVRENDTKTFPSSQFRYAARSLAEVSAMAIAIDPAISEDRRADMAAIAVVALLNNNTFHIFEAFGRVGMSDDDKITKFFEFYDRYLRPLPLHKRMVGVESVAYQRALAVSLEKARNERMVASGFEKYSFPVTQITHGKTGKLVRVQGILRPVFASGALTFDRIFPDLEDQLDLWPAGKRDIPDAVAMALKMLAPAGFTYPSTEPEQELVSSSAPVNFRHAP